MKGCQDKHWESLVLRKAVTQRHFSKGIGWSSLEISQLEHCWQVLKYSINVNFCSTSQNKSVLCILPIPTHAATASMLPFLNELVFHVLLLSSKLPFPNNMKQTWYSIYTIIALANPSEISWHQTYVKFMRSWMSYVCLSSCPYLHIMSILTQQCPIFLYPSATFVLELIDLCGLIYSVLNKISNSTEAYLLKILHYSLKSSSFFLFINT